MSTHCNPQQGQDSCSATLWQHTLCTAEVLEPELAQSSSRSHTQLSVLSGMNAQLAAENASLIAELAKLQRRHHRQTGAIQPGLLTPAARQASQQMETVAGISVHELAQLLTPPGMAASATSVPGTLLTLQYYIGEG